MSPEVVTARPTLPLIDPTANVLSHVEAAVTRLDDLRDAEGRRVDGLRSALIERLHLEIDHVKELADVAASLRADHAKEIRLMESARVDAVSRSESGRIDALLAAAKADIALASEKTAAANNTLANTVIATADTLRKQVDTTTASTMELINTMRETFDRRVSSVEQNQYAGGGSERAERESRGQSNVNRGQLLTLAISLAGWVLVIVLFLLKGAP